MNHKSAPLELREQFAVSDEQVGELLRDVQSASGVSGVMATMTCNRFEIYATAEDPNLALHRLEEWMASRRPGSELSAHLYKYSDQSALRHLFRVASSLDSMVVGEPQILGQLKAAYAQAEAERTLDGRLHQAVNRALSVAKRVRSETGVAKNAVSIPQVSVELARKIFGRLSGSEVALLGAGEMGELAAKSLQDRGVRRLHVLNRSLERAQKLAAQFDGSAHTVADLPDVLTRVDVLISSTSAQDYVITPELIRNAWPKRRHRPLLLIDIAVPRDIDPTIGEMANVYLFDVDDLQEIAQSNARERESEAKSAEEIVREAAREFHQSLKGDRVRPTIVALRERMHQLKDEELSRGFKGLSGLDE
ncbi:MAG: glutamyl-tRNA reductase, partial [Myxococcales bacterium]|nr:glutamyl-tRNA reductase [Myxococcales bacterium]